MNPCSLCHESFHINELIPWQDLKDMVVHRVRFAGISGSQGLQVLENPHQIWGLRVLNSVQGCLAHKNKKPPPP